MLDTVLDTLDPYIAELILLGISTYCGWIFRIFFRDKTAQENLHKALDTGVDLVTDMLAEFATTGKLPEDTSWKDLARIVSVYTQGSVPDALKKLKNPPQDHLEAMAKAKMNIRIEQLREAAARRGY